MHTFMYNLVKLHNFPDKETLYLTIIIFVNKELLAMLPGKSHPAFIIV